MSTTTLPLSEAQALLTAAFSTQGVPKPAATSVAKALVAAEAEGQVGHGFSRVADYIAQVQSGKINAGAQITLTTPSPTLIHVDADFGFAFPALEAGITRGLETAETLGMAAVSITNSHHCGALSVQMDRIARAGMIAIMMANTPKAMAPWGGATPFFGTNPIGFGVPRANSAPLIIDLSLSKVARGKIMHAKKSGQPIPEGWAIDSHGAPTTDPDAALAGAMLPMGDAKGSALALMVEILATTFTGATPSAQANSFLNADGPPPATGQFVMILKPGVPGFADRLSDLLTQITDIPGTRLPGDRRLKSIKDAQDNGLKVPTHYITQIRAFTSP